MTAERFVYNTDMRERKNIAYSAKKKKGGSKSKKCTLPSDGKSAAQKQQMNGPVETVSLNAPMTYEQLKTLNPSLQFLYLDHLVKDYHARRVDIQKMLGVATATLSKVQKSLPNKLAFDGKKKKMSPEWEKFIAGDQKEDKPTESDDDKKQTIMDDSVSTIELNEKSAAEENTEEMVEILSGNFTVCGNAKAMMTALLRMIEQDGKYTFNISFKKEV